ncbi:hypothetical protein Back11_41880 [Paenibacillus baekrokdamisoli]|uniref:Signal peptidase I n=1 Tax=Paenibacillus baekrokdamisoli TaxID=1712516 RepID=A0A3G9JD18_9BACL|nr:signal peptidase I [Paenibacillus baekrokdamisoli]MBB3068113.1 signal peptidase I [Paenibacillus baekrokdamisoli]BBH22843.1 hypothetical protein Back11_41880 [Paenibacillus baekrokdamisoli]
MKTAKRSFLLAGIASLFIPGLGQVYNGQLKKAVMVILSLLFLPFLIFSYVKTWFWSLPILIAFLIIVHLVALVDAIVSAARRKTLFTLRRYNRWYMYVSMILLYVLIAKASPFQSIVGVNAFIVDGPSMSGTLVTDDRILVNTDARDYKNGDVIVFPYERRTFVKRIIASAGDTIQFKNDVVYVNKQRLEESYIKASRVRDYAEHLTTKETVVPPGCLYVLGDNRVNSMDSRYIGMISTDSVTGKVMYIYYSKDHSRIGTKL